MTTPGGIAEGSRYVGVAVIPKRRAVIERALGRVAELGGDALLITADGSARPKNAGVRHIDLLNAEMHRGLNRVIAVSPKRVAGRLVGKRVRGRSLAWRHWVKSRPYKVIRYHVLWRALKPRLAEVRPESVTHILIAGVESWPIAWHITQVNPGVQIVWDVPEEWKPPE